MPIESTSLQQTTRDLVKSFINFFNNPKTRKPKFHTKKNTKDSFRQTIRKDKLLVMGKYLHLRKYGKIRYRTSKKIHKHTQQYKYQNKQRHN